uniref:Uncharacterized protein n=1 Tax=Aegilops tauschii subsp. strangulata TaxID=200361 RepID=A0A453K332_AEGTS
MYILLVTGIHAYSERVYVLPNLSSRSVSRVTVHSIQWWLSGKVGITGA